MRAFLAIPVTGRAEDELRRIQHGLERLNITQTFTTHYHLTLHFFGDITEDNANALGAALATFTFAPFTAHLTPPQSFPPEKPARVIYAGAEPYSALAALHNALHAHLRLPPDPRPFTPHITLSRVKAGHVMETQLEYLVIQPVEWTVSRIVMYTSELTPNGPVYTELANSKF